MNEQRWNDRDKRRIAEAISDIDICMLVTRSQDGLRGRPMSNNGKVEYDGDSWFFSYRDTPKVEAIDADPRVELAYLGTDKGAWVSIEGRAEIVDDDARKQELWEDSLAGWFKEGPEDDDVILIKVGAERIHAWIGGEELLGEAGGELKVVESVSES